MEKNNQTVPLETNGPKEKETTQSPREVMIPHSKITTLKQNINHRQIFFSYVFVLLCILATVPLMHDTFYERTKLNI